MTEPGAQHSPTRPVTRYILIGIALITLAVMTWRIREVVVIAFGGMVGAAVLRGLADPLARRTGWSQHRTILTVIFALVVLAAALVWFLGTRVAQEATEMQRLIPASLDQLSEILQRSAPGRTLVNFLKQLPGDSKTLSNLGLAAGALLVAVADLLLVFFLAIYFALDSRGYLETALRLLPPGQRDRVRAALVDAGQALRKWLLAQLVAMGCIAVLVGAGLGLLGVPLALLLAVVAGVLEFIPVAGAVLFTIPGVLIAFTKGPNLALYTLLVYIGVQQIESNILIPLLQRWAVRLPPAITLLSVVVGGLLLGAPGLVFSTPLAVVAMTLVKHLYVEETLEHAPPASTETDGDGRLKVRRKAQD